MSSAPTHAPTPGQTIGPFFGFALPCTGGPQLVVPGTPGAVQLTGRVLDGAGDAVPDALVEVWQAGADGRVVARPGSLRRDGHTFTGFGRAAAERVLADVRAQAAGLRALAAAHRGSVQAARTLTQHAVPTTFGLVAAGWLHAVLDAEAALAAAAGALPAQVGGAAGTLSAVTELAAGAGQGDAPAAALGAAADLAARLGLRAAPPWHTRRRPVTALGDALVACTDAWGTISADVLVRARPEVGELRESRPGGSSTMPHKANPVLSVLVRRAPPGRSGAVSAPLLAVTDLGGSGPLLVVGPSLGTAATTLWRACAAHLTDRAHVLAWDLPGHGASEPATGLTTADLAAGVLAAGVLAAVDGTAHGAPFALAGDSLAAPERLTALVVACSGPRIGTPDAWHERAAAVRAGGLRPGGPVLEATPSRWFGPGFAERSPELARRLLAELSTTDAESYAACCEALADCDVRAHLHEVAVPVLAVAGSADRVTPTALLRHVATGVRDGRLVELDGVAHLAPAEAPEHLAALVAEHVRAAGDARGTRSAPTTAQVRAEGVRVRREVLGDAHVDRAGAATTDLTADFQELITQYAWGSIWTRPGLDRRSRSIAVLTALVARGHHEELAMHVRAALRNGLSAGEVEEVLLQSAVYCGVPDAAAAFRIASTVLSEHPEQEDPS